MNETGKLITKIIGSILLVVIVYLLFSYLDEYLNANGATPQVAGLDAHHTPFVAWLNEEGGDCVYLTVTRLVEDDGGTFSRTSEETPGQGQSSQRSRNDRELCTQQAASEPQSATDRGHYDRAVALCLEARGYRVR